MDISKSKHINDIKRKHFFATLPLDEESNERYIKIFVDDYEELGILKYCLLKSIAYMAESYEVNTSDEAICSIKYLSIVLKEIERSMRLEYQGLDRITSL